MEISEILKLILDFRDRRGWKIYHTPKNLVISLAVEMGELLELFQWMKDDEIQERLKERDYRERVGEEISDVLIYLLLLANECGVDIEKAVLDKMRKNAEKYPER